MISVNKPTIEYTHRFEASTRRHYLNGFQSAFHCHHYTALYTQLALDSEQTELLQKSAYDSFLEVLVTYLEQHPEVESFDDKVEVLSAYYAMVGLGQLKVVNLGKESGEVELLSSHTDDGWKRKFGEYDRPINFIGAGFIQAMTEVLMDLPNGSIVVTETQSIAMGAETSIFKLFRK